MIGEWTSPPDVITTLRRRWDRGVYLTARARGEEFAVVDVPIRGPKAGELGERFDEVRAWVAKWHNAAESLPWTVTRKTVGGRSFGANTLPARVQVTGIDDLARILGTTKQIRAFDTVLDAAQEFPPIAEWVTAKPMRALAHQDEFSGLMRAVGWISDNAGSGRRLREIDAPGLDTKFVEQHHRILLELTEMVVDPDLVRPQEKSIAVRFGFATDSTRVRFRLLDPDCASPAPGFDDIEVRTMDLAATPLAVDRVFIIENLATYLSFPPTLRAAAIFGGGYAATVIGALRWLRDRQVYYWGDIDTHGFAILDRVRVTIPQTRSMLMDMATLLAHRELWGTEPSQVDRPLHHLTADEATIYRHLLDDTHGPRVRLEQERIPLRLIATAPADLAP
ncbi:Wadjet anti-phage system protein JetD domain-containing protein [Gordonia sp. CPCC 205515]|uniref:Wadjet anti-phage system protein JetD domain-containing protein n=1 Tax=Gordonia sp. CPCC 205515 TaxID=3140791 RepID=UPI003AF39610